MGVPVGSLDTDVGNGVLASVGSVGPVPMVDRRHHRLSE
jgi:hypothetical protein